MTIKDGEVHLTARPAARNGGGPAFTSGMLASADRFQFTYGYVEARARLPAGQGLWPALWLLPADQSFPPEIDLVEMVGQHPTTATLTYHSVADGTPQAHVTTPDLSAGWHTFALDWQPGSLTWFIDGVPQFHVSNGVPIQPMYLIATLAVGGTEPGPPKCDDAVPSDPGHRLHRGLAGELKDLTARSLTRQTPGSTL